MKQHLKYTAGVEAPLLHLNSNAGCKSGIAEGHNPLSMQSDVNQTKTLDF